MKKIVFIFFLLLFKNSSVCFSQNSWIQMSNFGGGVRNSAVSFSIGSKGYVGTGSPNNTGLNLQNDFWEFDPSTNIWTQKANYGGGPRLGAVCFSIGTKGYIGLGSDANMIYRDFWEYDPFTNIWTQMADFPGSLRHAAVGFSIGTKGYIGTGNAPTGGALQDFWEYDPSSDSWSQKSNFGGIARTEAVGFSIGNHGYIGTGWIPNGISLQDFWEYDPTLDTWNQKSSFGGNPRVSAVSFSIGSKGYIGIGLDGSFSRDFWEYDKANDTWAQKTNYGGPGRSNAVGFSVGGKGYVGTGWAGSFQSDCWEYTPDSINSEITQYDQQQSISIYPNPIIDKLNIESNNSNFFLELYELSGNLLVKEVISSKQYSLNMNEFYSGIYFLILNSNNKSFRWKIIKK